MMRHTENDKQTEMEGRERERERGRGRRKRVTERGRRGEFGRGERESERDGGRVRDCVHGSIRNSEWAIKTVRESRGREECCHVITVCPKTEMK